MLQFKSVSNSSHSGIIKDVDPKKGMVTGYFSIYGNVDSDGDIIMPGAYSRTLNNNYKRLKHLNQHKTWEPLSGTKNDRLMVKDDGRGLYFESLISQTSYGKDVVLLYEDGVIDEHSVGIEVVKSRDSDTQTVERWGQKVAVREISEVKLWEGSTVTWGANARAGTESVKSLTKEQAFEKMSNILKALKNGKYENEEIFEALEYEFKQLEQHISELSTPPALPAQDSPSAELLTLDASLKQQFFIFQAKPIQQWN